MNKTFIVLGILVGVVAVALFFMQKPTTLQLAGAEFYQAYSKTSGAMLLDVRTPAEFSTGHLAGAVNIDFESSQFVSQIQALEKHKDYFVYCRSGNRSNQAISLMKEAGILSITELKGGIIANQQSIKLVTGEAVAQEEYVVDPSDMVDGSMLIAGAKVSSLSNAEIDGLVHMREEEKLAHDVYATLGEKWGVNIFANIARSEQTHTDAVKVLLDRYGIEDPSSGNAVGVFRSTEMQKLYKELTAKGLLSLSDALQVGATIEDLDINDLEIEMKKTDKQDIELTYQNLQKGSRNHMRAFVRNIVASGGTYVPKYISQDDFTSIINSPQERGKI